MNNPFNIGTRVTISQGSGLDSSKTGTIVPRTAIKTDHHLIPTNVQGAYNPVNWRTDVAILLDNGILITMFKSHLSTQEAQP